MKFFNRHNRVPQELRPSREFIDRTRETFLASFRSTLGVHPSRMILFTRYALRGVAVVVIVMLIGGGGVFYADAANVGPTSLLYTLKRSGEALTLTFAREETKPALHLKFAERRLEEMQELESVVPPDRRVLALTSDFKKEVSHSLSDVAIEQELEVQDPGVQEGGRKETSPSMAQPIAAQATSPSAGAAASGPQNDEDDFRIKALSSGAIKEQDKEKESKLPLTDEDVRLPDRSDGSVNTPLGVEGISASRNAKERASRNEFCQRFERVVQRVSVEMRRELLEEEGIGRRAKKKCGEAAQESQEFKTKTQDRDSGRDKDDD